MKFLFIIAHKYYRKYESFIEFYINNINTFYNDDADILIVDNNSTHYQDIEDKVSKYNNVTFIINTSDSKFELGAYRFGINYLGDKIKEYEYIVFSQDTFVLKNKYDFNNLIINDVKATTVLAHHEYYNEEKPFYLYNDEIKAILQQINMYNKLDKILLCCCSTFILHNSTIDNFMKFTNHIKLTIRKDSEIGERYLGRILYELNNDKIFYIDGYMGDLKYCRHNTDMYPFLNGYNFQKKLQQKDELTLD